MRGRERKIWFIGQHRRTCTFYGYKALYAFSNITWVSGIFTAIDRVSCFPYTIYAFISIEPFFAWRRRERQLTAVLSVTWFQQLQEPISRHATTSCESVILQSQLIEFVWYFARCTVAAAGYQNNIELLVVGCCSLFCRTQESVLCIIVIRHLFKQWINIFCWFSALKEFRSTTHNVSMQ